MKVDINNILEVFLKDSKANSVLIVNNSGEIIKSTHYNDDEIMTAMCNAIQSMSEKFIENFEFGNYKQIIIKTDKNMIFITAINSELNSIVIVVRTLNKQLVVDIQVVNNAQVPTTKLKTEITSEL